MRFSTISAALAFVASAAAQTAGFDPITAPQTGEVIPAGSTYTIKWQSTVSGLVSLGLIGGNDPKTLVPLGNFATGVESSAGQYAWSVSPTLGAAKTYGIVLTLESNTSTFQYSFPFSIQGSGSSGTGNSTSTAAPTSSSAVVSSYATSAKPTSTPIYYTTTPAGNLSTTARPTSSQTTLTGVSQTSTSTRPAGTSAVPNGAARQVAGSLALVGGIAAAMFAL